MGIESLQQSFGHLTAQGKINRFEQNPYVGGAPTTTAEVVPSYKQAGYKATIEDMEKILAAQNINVQNVEQAPKVAAHQGRAVADPYGQYDRELSPDVSGTHLGGKFDSNNCDWYCC